MARSELSELIANLTRELSGDVSERDDRTFDVAIELNLEVVVDRTADGSVRLRVVEDEGDADSGPARRHRLRLTLTPRDYVGQAIELGPADRAEPSSASEAAEAGGGEVPDW